MQSLTHLFYSVLGSLPIVIFACLYGFFLSQIPDIHFKDFNNYIRYADDSLEIVSRYLNRGVIPFLSNEPFWLLLNVSLNIYLPPEAVVRTIIFLGGFSVAYLVLRHYPQYFIWLIVILLFPQVIKNYIIHLRQGAAIAVFLWGWFTANRAWRWLIMGTTPFIHASFFFILLLLALAWVLSFIRFGPSLRAILFLVAGVAVGFGLGVIADFLGSRQVEYYDFKRTDVSGLGFMLWALILGLLLSAGRVWLRGHVFETGVVIFYLATYWLIEVTARIFESGLIVVLLAGLTLPGWRAPVFMGIVLGSGTLMWFLRIGQPALGFA